jgi:hypothetical protein
MSLVPARSTCRICGSPDLDHVFTLGDHYVSDFVDPGKAFAGIRCPIELVKCNYCTLVQNPHTAPQELLYTGHYWYRSGVTQTMKAALADIVVAANKAVTLNWWDVVLDIGSNDGTLLRCYNHRLFKVGVEPAKNFAEVGAVGVNLFINDFWNANCIAPGAAKVITAIGMFYDLDDPNQFISDIATALHKDGVFIAQLMCLQNMINCSDIGNLAHEHLEFYTLKSLQYLLGKHGLELYDIETNNTNGESYRLFVQHKDGQHKISSSVAAYQSSEQDIMTALQEFLVRMNLNKIGLQQFIFQQMAERSNKRIWVYGASTKGNTILQYLALDHYDIQGASERSPEKWGKVTAGSNIPIHSEETARKAMPDYFLVLPYAFIDEFIKREANQPWRKQGGKFIVPLPEWRIL